MNQRPLADAFFEARDLGPQPLANLGGLLRAEPRDLRKPAGAAPIDQRGQIGEGGHTGRSQVVCDVGRQPGRDRIGRLRGQGAQHPVEGVQGGAQRRHRARAAPCGPARGLAVFGGRGVQFIQQGLQLALREVGIALFEFGQGRAGTGRRRGQGRGRRQRPLEDAGEAGALLGVVVALGAQHQFLVDPLQLGGDQARNRSRRQVALGHIDGRQAVDGHGAVEGEVMRAQSNVAPYRRRCPPAACLA